MVKNIPTIERSTKIRFGKHATDDQGENTIVFNASNAAIDTSVPGSIYMTPLRQEDDITSRDITMITYNTETKEIIDSNVPAVDLFSINLQYATNNDNVTSNTVRFINDTTSFVTTGNVGIQNTSPTHALDVGSNVHVTKDGEVRVGPSILIDSNADNKIQVSGRINTNSITVDHIGLSNTNPTITGLSLGSNTFLQHPTASINAFSTTGNVSAAFYHGDSYFLSNLNLDNIILQGNTAASKTVEFNKSDTSLITASNVGIANALPVHTLDVGSNLFVDDKGSNKLVVTGNTFTSRKALVGSNLVMDTLGSNVVEVTGNTFTSRKALIGSNVTIDTLGTNAIEVTGNTFTSRKALVGSNLVMDTLGSNVVEVTGNVNVSNYTKTDYITVQKDAHVKGNLLVEGATTTIDTTNTTFGDAVISLANNNILTTTDIGIIMKQPGSNASPTVTFRGDEKEMMIGYTLNSSLDTEITPDYANVIDLHVYGNVIAQNNITLTSGELTAITVNSNVVGDNVVATNGMYGTIAGSNTISASTINAVTINSNVVADNVVATNMYGIIAGSNTISASTISAITTNSNVVGDNVNVTNNIETTSGFFKGNGGILSNVSLQQVTDTSNSTTNTIASTNTTTGFISSGNVHVGSNIQVSGLTSGFVPIVGSDKFLHDSVIEYSGDTTTISSNVEITGNLSVLGKTVTIESDSLVINDRVLGIANNNVSHSLDVGIIMGHPGHNIAFIHHGQPVEGDPHEHEMVLGYTQNTVSDNHILDDANIITFRVLGDVIVQNNLTLTSGDLTAITVNSNVAGDNVSAITLNGNVVADNVVATNMYGTIAGSNTISASTINAVTVNSNVVADNVVATNMYGTIAGSNTISASTINAVTINSNVVADNVVATNMYGTIAGSNTISASTINAVTITGDGSAITNLDPSNLSSQVLLTKGGTGLTSVAENELLLGPASGTALTKLTPYTGPADVTVPVAMTANSSGGNTASSGDSSVNAYKAFDGSDSTNYVSPEAYSSSSPYGYTGSNSLGGVNGEWVKIQLASAFAPTSVFVKARPNGTNFAVPPNSWRIMGSTDGTNWTQLHASTTLVDSSSGTTESFTNTTSYTYLGIVVTNINFPGMNDRKWTLSHLLFSGPGPGPSEKFLRSSAAGIVWDEVSSTLQTITDGGASTTNEISFTNGVTSLSASGNVVVTGNVTASTFKSTTLTSGKIPYTNANKELIDGPIGHDSTTNVTSVASNLVVTGNLTVQGTTTFQHSNIHTVSDPIIEIGNANAIDTIDMGVIMTRPTANVVSGYMGDEKKYVIAYTLTDPDGAHIVPTNATSDQYMTLSVEGGNVLAGNVITTSPIEMSSGGTGLTSIAQNELLLGPASGTALAKLSAYTGPTSITAPPSGMSSTTQTIGGIQYTSSASTTWSGTATNNAFDYNNSTIWRSSNEPGEYYTGSGNYNGSNTTGSYSGAWIQLYRATAFAPTSIQIIPAQTTFAAPSGWKVFGSTNGSSWTEIHSSSTAVTWNSGNGHTATISGSAAYNYLRLAVQQSTIASSVGTIAVSEVRFSSQGTGPTEKFLRSSAAGIVWDEVSSTLQTITDGGATTTQTVAFNNTTTGLTSAGDIDIAATKQIDYAGDVLLKSSAGAVASLKVNNAIKLDPAYTSPSNNVLSFNTTTGEIYDSGGQGGSTLANIIEEGANVAIGPSAASANLTVNTYGSNVLTVSGNVSADNITIGALNVAASPFALDDVVSVNAGANVTANVLTLGGLVTSGNVNTGNVITTGDITISGNTTSQNIKLTNTDISATISSGTITIDAKEKTYGTAPLVVSTTDVSNLVFSNFITGAQIVVSLYSRVGVI